MSEKVRFKADTLSTIIQTIFKDEDIDVTVSQTDKEEWLGKKLTDILNLEYYSFKKKAGSTKSVVEEMVDSNPGLSVGKLDVLKRSFCFVSIENLERLFSQDIDEFTVDGVLTFWIQTEKIKLLEELIENAAIETCGLRIPTKIDGKERSVMVIFGNVKSEDIQATEIGESCVVPLTVSLIVKPNVYSYSDYKIDFLMVKEDGVSTEYVNLPIKTFSFTSAMVNRSLPRANAASTNDTINLSNTTNFAITFDGIKNNQIVEMFAKDSLSRASNLEESKKEIVNKVYTMRVTRGSESYIYSVKVTQHSIIPNNTTEDEAHSLVLTTGRV